MGAEVLPYPVSQSLQPCTLTIPLKYGVCVGSLQSSGTATLLWIYRYYVVMKVLDRLQGVSLLQGVCMTTTISITTVNLETYYSPPVKSRLVMLYGVLYIRQTMSCIRGFPQYLPKGRVWMSAWMCERRYDVYGSVRDITITIGVRERQKERHGPYDLIIKAKAHL